MKPVSLPRRNSLIGFIPIRSNKARKPSLIARTVDRLRRSARRIGVWSEGVHWATVADAIFFSVFMLSLFVLYWCAYLMGWCGR
ncbi:MAG: hypothetical protein M0Z38_13125 [Deltaproteobacteria bacterium]|nr:hypothetical protein [Deltaproteobacteria bacterium]